MANSLAQHLRMKEVCNALWKRRASVL